MESHLTIKHLAAYLPYGLKIQGQTHGEIQEMTGLNSGVVMINHNTKGWADFFDIKPILRPLSDIEKQIDHNGEKFVPMERLTNMAFVNYEMGLLTIDKDMSLKDYFKLLKWHFDVFGLIENGAAIDINTLK